MSDTHIERKLYSINHAAKAMDVSRSQIYRWIAAGELRSIRIGKRGQRIPADELDRWVRERVDVEGGDAA